MKWWCNEGTNFHIERHKYLKEFIIKNPPAFRISAKCCEWSKKKVSDKYIKENNFDLCIIGVRKSEGGVRASSYKTCFDSGDKYDKYRPLFWYSDEDKFDYIENQHIKYSDCYTKYGFKRTGCVCCPFGYVNNQLQHTIAQTKKYEPKLYTACENIFGESWRYTFEYLQFRKDMKLKEKGKRKLF